MQLILASSSPQRQRLLKEAGYEFDIFPPPEGVEDGPRLNESARDYVLRAAKQKAGYVANRAADGLVIGCDTAVECGGRILGKPRDAADARRMLEALRGRAHHVYSGLCLWPVVTGRPRLEVATAKLRMDELSMPQINEYVASEQWRGKAGGFGYQDRVGWLRLIAGSESNVIGLPLELFTKMLAEFERPLPS